MTFRPPIIYRQPNPPPGQGHIQGRAGVPKGDKQFRGPGQWATYDYPNPRGPQYPTSLLTWTDPAKIWLIGKDKQFKGPGQWQTYDYPNPIGWDCKSSAQPSILLKTWTDPTKVWLIGKDKQFADAGQWKSYDYPNPSGPVRTVSLSTWTQSLNQTTLKPAVQNPFSQEDWPNPIGPGFPLELRTIALNLQPILKVDFLARQPAYAPYRTVRVTTDDPVPNLLTMTLGGPSQAPFAQENWPNPLGPSYRDTSFIQDLNLQLLGQDRFFGAPGQGPANLDWPNPRGPVRLDLTWLQSSPQTQVAQVSPFSLKDWTNPAGPAFPQDLRGYIQDLNLELIGQDRFFGAPGQGPANLDWPVPKGPVGSIELRTWLVNLSQGTLAPAFVQPPFNFTDWKNPWAAGFPLDLRSFLDANRLNNPIPPFVPVVVEVPPVGGGASGAKRYRQPPWWGDEKKKKLEKKVEAVQKLIQKKREQIDFAPDLLRMERLVEQLQELQKRLMKLLEQIEELNKEAEEEEVIRIYTIYRSLH